jgi:hypothetical protein
MAIHPLNDKEQQSGDELFVELHPPRTAMNLQNLRHDVLCGTSSNIGSSSPSLGQLQPGTEDEELHRRRVLTSLRGLTIRIPNLALLFQNWPTKVNPELDRLRIEVKQWLDRYVL